MPDYLHEGICGVRSSRAVAIVEEAGLRLDFLSELYLGAAVHWSEAGPFWTPGGEDGEAWYDAFDGALLPYEQAVYEPTDPHYA